MKQIYTIKKLTRKSKANKKNYLFIFNYNKKDNKCDHSDINYYNQMMLMMIL